MAGTGIISESDDDGAIATLRDPPAAAQGGRAQQQQQQRSAEPDYVAVETDSDFKPLGGEGEAVEQRGQEPALDADSAAGDRTLLEQQEQARQREPRTQRRERQKAAKDRNLQELQFLRRRVGELEEVVHTIEPRLSGYDQAQAQAQVQQLDRDIDGQARVAADARRRMAQAMTDADHEGLNKALDDRDRAIMLGQQLTVRRNLLATGNVSGQANGARDQQQQQRREMPAAPRMPAVVQDNVEDFSSRYPWYNPRDKRHVDSQIVLQLDNAVAADGYDPASPEYWDELEDRMKDYLPRRFADDERPGQQNGNGRAGNGQRQAQQQQAAAQSTQQTAPQRRGPPMGAPGDRGPGNLGPNQVYISPERKQAMILAGALDSDGRTITNSEKYRGYLKKYAEYDRANGVARQ